MNNINKARISDIIKSVSLVAGTIFTILISYTRPSGTKAVSYIEGGYFNEKNRLFFGAFIYFVYFMYRFNRCADNFIEWIFLFFR